MIIPISYPWYHIILLFDMLALKIDSMKRTFNEQFMEFYMQKQREIDHIHEKAKRITEIQVYPRMPHIMDGMSMAQNSRQYLICHMSSLSYSFSLSITLFFTHTLSCISHIGWITIRSSYLSSISILWWNSNICLICRWFRNYIT